MTPLVIVLAIQNWQLSLSTSSLMGHHQFIRDSGTVPGLDTGSIELCHPLSVLTWKCEMLWEALRVLFFD